MNACGCQFCKTKNFAFPLLQRCWNFLFEARIRERIIVCMKGFLSVFFLALHCLFAGEQVFKISEFGAFPGKGDASGAVAAALKAAARPEFLLKRGHTTSAASGRMRDICL